MFNKITLYLWLLFATTHCTTTKKTIDPDKDDVMVTYSGDELSSLNPALPETRSKIAKNHSVAVEKQIRKNSQQSTTNLKLELAKTSILRADLANAAQTAKAILRQDLKNTKAKKLLASIYLQNGESGLAQLILESLRTENDRDPEIFNLLAVAAYAQNNYALCFAHLQSALQLNDKYLAARLNLASLYMEFSEFSNAAIQLERTLSIEPDNIDAQLQLATVKSILGDFDAARAFYNTVLDKHEDVPLAQINWVMFNKRIGNYDVAIDALESFQDKNNASPTPSKQEDLRKMLADLKSEREVLNHKTSDEDIKRLANELRLKNSEQAESDSVQENGIGL